MARSSAAAARAPRGGASHGRSTRSGAKKPARRASGAHRTTAQRNAAALKRSAAAHKAAGARKAAPKKTSTRKAAGTRSAARKPAAQSMRGAAAGGAVALPLPLRVARAPFTRSLRARGGGLLDALLHGRGWIGLVFVLLAGIVFFNVDLLKLNRDIAATAQKASGVARENARLRLQLAKLDSSERIQRSAASRGLLLPAPGDVRYLTANPLIDARRAAKLVEAPDAAAVAPAPVPQAAAPVAPATAPQATTTPQPAPTAVSPAPAQAQPPVAQVQQQPAGGAGATTTPAG